MEYLQTFYFLSAYHVAQCRRSTALQVYDETEGYKGCADIDKRPDHFEREHDLCRHFATRQAVQDVSKRVLFSLYARQVPPRLNTSNKTGNEHREGE